MVNVHLEKKWIKCGISWMEAKRGEVQVIRRMFVFVFVQVIHRSLIYLFVVLEISKILFTNVFSVASGNEKYFIDQKTSFV